MSHSPSLSQHSAPHYPESELEHSHSRTPSTVGLSPIPTSRPSPFSLNPSPSSHTPHSSTSSSPTSFVSFSTIPADASDDALLSSTSSSAVDAEELTRQSLGSRTSSPRLPHSSLSPHSADPTTLPPSAIPAIVSPAASSYYHTPTASVDVAASSLTLGLSPSSQLDPGVADIIAQTRLLEEKTSLPPSSPSSSSSSSSAYEQLAVVYSAGLLQLSQRLQELRHPLSKRVMVSFGAASGQMKQGDLSGCVVTCKRAVDCLEGWQALLALGCREAMTRLLKQFKQAFVSSDPVQCRLLYVEFFLTLSALLAPTHSEWALALQSSAQKGLKAQPQEAIKSMTKITKLLFSAGLSKPPSAYRSRGEGGHSRAASVGVERVEKEVDVRAVEVEQAVRMMQGRQKVAGESRESEAAEAAAVEEKRLTVEDAELVLLSLGLSSHHHADEHSHHPTLTAAAVKERISKVASLDHRRSQQPLTPLSPSPLSSPSPRSPLCAVRLGSCRGVRNPR